MQTSMQFPNDDSLLRWLERHGLLGILRDQLSRNLCEVCATDVAAPSTKCIQRHNKIMFTIDAALMQCYHSVNPLTHERSA